MPSRKREPSALPPVATGADDAVKALRHPAKRRNIPSAGLEWSGKRDRPWFDFEPAALHIHEPVSTQAMLRVPVREDVARSANRAGRENVVYAGFDAAAQAGIDRASQWLMRLPMAPIRANVAIGDLLKAQPGNQPPMVFSALPGNAGWRVIAMAAAP